MRKSNASWNSSIAMDIAITFQNVEVVLDNLIMTIEFNLCATDTKTQFLYLGENYYI